jgi:uncharacterized repeat protein (TIGR03806 family)
MLAQAAVLPPGFREARIAAGINGATAMEIAPDGRVFICEQTGTLRIVKNDTLLPTPFVTLTVDSSWERGLLGVALDPHFTANHYVYLNYIVPTPYPHHRISRFTAAGDVAVPHSEVVLFEGDNQELLGGGVKNGHQGGAIHFGADGKLYMAIGDQTAGEPAQSLRTLQGKILRLNADGSIPPDNPFYQQTMGKYRAIWALGLRNPFTFAVQPGTGRMFINDVGGANEEINEGFAGANYGWPTVDHGPTPNPRFRGPVYWYPESSIAGGAFYNPRRVQFPPEYAGKYFFADFKAGWIKTLDPDHPAQVKDFATRFPLWQVVDLKVSDDGCLYYLTRNAWVRDKDFRPNTGALYRVRYTGERMAPTIVAQPAAQTIPDGGAAYFRVTVAGTPPFRFQWRRNDRAILGATEPTYLLPRSSETLTDGTFRCEVTNAYGKVVSEPARLTVLGSDQETEAKAHGGFLVLPTPGNYTGPITVRLSYHEPAIVRYTCDNAPPTILSSTYMTPIVLHETTTLKVRAFNREQSVSETVSLRFTIAGSTPYGLSYRQPVQSVRMPPLPEHVPRWLSETGVFASLRELRPNLGILPYNVLAPLWSDGAFKQRWIAPAPGGRIDFRPTGEWTFPAGTVLVKHFELATDENHPEKRRRLETRLLVVDGTGHGYGVTYKWQPDNRDAELLAQGQYEALTIQTAKGPRSQTWYYPSREDCLACHTGAAKFVLGVKTRQLNGSFTYPETGITDNQLRTWNYLGMFRSHLPQDQFANYPRFVALDDASAPLEARARSYLDSNCAHCHRPGNTLRATFDARFDTPLPQQGLVNALTVSDSLSVRDPRVLAPGDCGRSMILRRLTRSDSFRMPPVGVRVLDRAALRVLEQWVRKMPVARTVRQFFSLTPGGRQPMLQASGYPVDYSTTRGR